MSILNYENLVDPLLRNLRKFTVEFAGMQAGDRVIDVCCGTGAQTLEYGRLGIMAAGIDNSREMLSTAIKNKTRQNARSVSFQLADAASLPFPDGSFDYASISFALHDKAKDMRYRIVPEMKRVVKHNGAIVLIDFQVPLPRNIPAILVRMVEFLAGGDHYRGFKEYMTGGGLKEIVSRPGVLEERRSVIMGGIVVAVKLVNGDPRS